jgi:transcriptional regulator with XRE-family HTH domain
LALNHLAENLKLLCSYGKSTSDICRRVGINRHQFDKYLTGKSQPSLATLRRICDFFGVDEYEILLDAKAFRDLVRLRPPRIGPKPDMMATVLGKLTRTQATSTTVLDQLPFARVFLEGGAGLQRGDQFGADLGRDHRPTVGFPAV